MGFVIENGVLKDYKEEQGVTEIIIPNGITKIDESAFSGCKNITSVVIPDGVTEISNFAFYNCSVLRSVTIPDSVVEYGCMVFTGCTALESINVSPTYPYISSFDIEDTKWYRENKDEFAVLGCELIRYNGSAKIVFIPDSVTVIGDRAFMNNTVVEQVVIHDGVTAITGVTFCGCKNLKEINLPDSITKIGPRSFEDCVSLTSIKLPKKLKEIDMLLFCGCENLVSINIPSSVELLWEHIFAGCTSLKEVILEEPSHYILKDGILYSKEHGYREYVFYDWVKDTYKYQWIDNDVDVSDILKKCPESILELIDSMQRSDIADDYISFEIELNSLKSETQKLVLDDKITEQERNKMCGKFKCTY